MKKIIYTVLMGAAIFATSCSKDFMEVDTYSIVSPKGVYSNQDNILKGLVGVYSEYYNGRGDYYIKPHVALANYPTLDMQADGWDAQMSTHSWTVESKSGFFDAAWSVSYRQVSRANLYLRDIESVPEEVIAPAELDMYKAEARAIRAYAYYYLTVNFSRVPMLMTGETYANAPDKARPDSDTDAWQIIKEDFEYAASLLDWEPKDGMKGRWTKGAALAYAAKANMYLGDYAKAKLQYAEIESSLKYKLNPCYAMTSWVDNPWNVEAVWEIAFPEFSNMQSPWSERINSDIRYFGQQTKPREYGGWGDSFTSFELARSYEPGDKRKEYSLVSGVTHDINPFTGDKVGKTAVFANPFLSNAEYMPNNHSLKWWKVNTQYSSHSVNLYRYAGVLLDYAECCFRTGDVVKGWALISQIRNRAWGNTEVGTDPNAIGSTLVFPTAMLNTSIVAVPDAQTYYTAYKATKGYNSDVWMVALMQERRKELYMEFSLYYDLSRCDMVEEWLNCEYPKNGGATFYNTVTHQYLVPSGIDKNEPWNNASVADRANLIPVTARDWDWNPIHLVFPIPTAELTANKLMTQNEGY